MDIAQLRTLIHVAELGSLSKAAERLDIAQPALGRQIRQLEQELGVYLFERHGRGMHITEAGRDALQHAVRVVDELEALRRSVAATPAALRGTVAIGATPTIAETLTVPLVQRIRALHPALSIRFCSAFSGYLVDWLQRGELDMAISYEPPALQTLRCVPVMMEELLLVGPPTAQLQPGQPLRLAQLAGIPLVLPSTRHGLRRILDQCASAAGVQLAASVEADSFAALLDLVSHGVGFTVLPLAAVRTRLQAGSLCAAPLIDPTPTRKVVLMTCADRPLSPAMRHVGETFVELMAQQVERGLWAGRLLPAGSSGVTAGSNPWLGNACSSALPAIAPDG